MVKLSICITTYNQVDILKKNVENLLRYPGDDIQIVVSDNCSQDDIKGMLDTFHDPRIKYCRLDSNKGQDINILNAFRNCDAPYAFLLRTKDTVIPEQIPTIIKRIYAHPNVGYWRFNCIDQDGAPRDSLSDQIFGKGEEAALAQEKIMIHPSGEIYNLTYLDEKDYSALSEYLQKHFQDHLGFVVHPMIRILLASRSDIATAKEFVWVLLTGEAASRGTVNVSASTKSVYHPDYSYPRYACEMEFVEKELPKELRLLLHKKLIRRYCQAVTVAYKYINQDKQSQRHYNCDEQPFSISEERKNFYSKTMEMIQDYPPEEQNQLKGYAVFCLTIMQFRWELSHFLGPLIKVKLLGALSLMKQRKNKAA